MERKITRKEYNHVVLSTRIFHKTYGERGREKKKEQRKKKKKRKFGGGGKEKEKTSLCLTIQLNHNTDKSSFSLQKWGDRGRGIPKSTGKTSRSKRGGKRRERRKGKKKEKKKRRTFTGRGRGSPTTNNQQRQTNSKKHPEKNLCLSHLFVPSLGKRRKNTRKWQQKPNNKEKERGNGVVQKGTTKEGKRRKEGEANNKQEREPWRNSRFIRRCPRMFFVCFAILS